MNTNVLSAAITKFTQEENEKVNDLMREYEILVDSNGVARIDRNKARQGFEEKFTEIFCD